MDHLILARKQLGMVKIMGPMGCTHVYDMFTSTKKKIIKNKLEFHFPNSSTINSSMTIEKKKLQ